MSAALDPTSDTSPLAAALRATARGWRPFPLDHPTHEDCIGGRCRQLREKWDGVETLRCPPGAHSDRGKHPIGGWATQTASPPSPAMLRMWFANLAVNVGIGCRASGLVVVDEDEDGALAAIAAERGVEIPRTYRVRTHRGWHYYFNAPQGRAITNKSGALKAMHIDVRGGAGADGTGNGGYVVAAGSTHRTGHVYTAEDPAAELAELPEWLITLINTRPDGTVAADSDYDLDDVRSGTWEDLEATYRLHLEQVTTPGFQTSFFTAARDGYRMVALGMPLEHVHADLFLVCQRVWKAAPDSGDRELLGQARRKAQSSPWELRGKVLELNAVAPSAGATAPSEEPHTDTPGHQTTASAEGEQEGTPYDPEEIARRAHEIAHAKKLTERVAELAFEDEARRLFKRQQRAEREPIAAGLLDSNDLDELPDPVMLLPDLIPQAGIGVLAGRFGTYKSFLTLSWACALATGRSWLGLAEFPVQAPIKVLYIAAEGANGMKKRKRAWARQFGAIPRGQLVFYPRAIRFNDEEDVAELDALIAEHGFELVIVDTLHRSAPGVEENSNTEVGLILDTAAQLRDDHQCTVLFVDHTGHGPGRPRGASAKEDDSEFVLVVDLEGDDRSANTQRVLRQRKLKEQDTDQSWQIRLGQNDVGAYVELGAPAAPMEMSSFDRLEREWWSPEQAPVPDAVMDLLKGVEGKTAAIDMFRLLRFVGGERGLTVDEIKGALAERPGRQHHRSKVHAGQQALQIKGVLVPGSTRDRFLIAPQYSS